MGYHLNLFYHFNLDLYFQISFKICFINFNQKRTNFSHCFPPTINKGSADKVRGDSCRWSASRKTVCGTPEWASTCLKSS